MICHFCHRDAIRKCLSCGLAICPDHGDIYCRVCSEAVFASSPEATGRAYLQCPPRPQMQTIYLDDDDPPECYRCQALARKVCNNCLKLYCREHGGAPGWCDECTASARVGNWITAGMLALVLALAVLIYLFRPMTWNP